MDLSILFWALSILLVSVGIVGTVLPVFPGPGVIFAGLLLAAWAEQFAYVGLGSIVFLAGLAILTYAVDFMASALGAKRMGASRRALLGAALGVTVGLFLGPVGIIVGPFVGAVLGELTVRGDLRKAGRAGLGAWIGLALGIAGKLALAFTMVGFFIAVRFL